MEWIGYCVLTTGWSTEQQHLSILAQCFFLAHFLVTRIFAPVCISSALTSTYKDSEQLASTLLYSPVERRKQCKTKSSFTESEVP